MPGCVRQSYGNVPLVLNVRETTWFSVTGMLAGAPVTDWNVTSCATPVMLNRTVLPTEMVRNEGLNTSPGVNTSTVMAPLVPGDVGAAFSPPEHAAVRRMPVMSHRARIRMPQLWRVAACLAVLAVTACSKGEGATGPSIPATPQGDYTLRTIDTKALPYTMFADTGYTLEIQSGTLTVTSGGRWVSRIVQRETVAGYVSTYADSTFGTWALPTGSTAPGSATFVNAETNASTTVTWTATDITVDDKDGTTTRRVVYRRN
jgi:hypothetical protein